MRGDILSGLDLLQQFRRGAANATSRDFDVLNLAFRIEQERAAISQASFFDQNTEVAGDYTRRVAIEKCLLDFEAV